MNTTALKIKLFGDSALRKKALPVKKVTVREAQILSAMAQLMHEHSGIGLAAPQVGINEAMLVADCGTGLYKLINPKIIRKKGSQVTEEGCLSVPDVCIKVKRANKIKIIAQDETGKPLSLEVEDLLACVFQHEIDHLMGRLIVDYASFFERLKIRKKLHDLRKRSEDGLCQRKTESCKLQL